MSKTITERIQDLVIFAKNDKTSNNAKEILGTIGDKEAVLLKLKTGFNLQGYTRIIDKSSIRHTIRKHGNIEKEKSRGQIAITDTDFELIPAIVQTKNIIFSGKSKLGKDCLLYEEIIDNVYYYVEEIRVGKKELCLQTIHKRKPKK